MTQIHKVLFVQQSEVLEQQRAEVRRTITTRLGVPVDFASSPEGVPIDSDVDVVIAPTVPWLAELLVRLPQLRWVHFLSAGVEKIWSMEFDWTTVKLSKSSGVHAAPMSEYAIGAMLHFAKEFDRFAEQSRQNIWQRGWLDELTDKSLVVLGMGSVGTAIAEKALTFGMNVVGIARNERFHSHHRVENLDTLHEHLRLADYVVATVPLTAKTRGLIDSSFFSSLKSGAVLIDISRGGVVKSEALVAALETGTLRGAVLDVFETEPLPDDSSLWNRENVLITPHVAGTTPHYLRRALKVFTSNAASYRGDQPLETSVDPEVGY